MEYTRDLGVKYRLMTEKEFKRYFHVFKHEMIVTPYIRYDDEEMVCYTSEYIRSIVKIKNNEIEVKDHVEEYMGLMLLNEEAEVECFGETEWYGDYCYAIVVYYVKPRALKNYEEGEKIVRNKYDDGIIVLNKKSGLVAVGRAMILDRDECFYLDSWVERECIETGEESEAESGFKAVKRELPLSEEVKAEYRLSALDFNTGKAVNQIISGETGCGKTYKAVNDEMAAGRRFAYVAPCRQLVYETYRKYADSEKDQLSSGEICINPDAEGNFYGVYESMTPERIITYDTLIIDEAHLINDGDRGGELVTLIAACREQNINIKLLTATQNFRLNDFEEIYLSQRVTVPEKKEVSWEQAMKNIDAGMQTIWFCGSIADTMLRADTLKRKGISAAAMNASLTPSERIRVQIAFEKKEIQVVCSTNVLAQGVNFECENLIIDDDYFETPEQLQQKIGRLGRPGTLEGKNEVYYCTYNSLSKIEKGKEKIKIQKTERDMGYIYDQLYYAQDMIRYGEEPCYNNIKYCIPQFIKWANDYVLDKNNKNIEIVESTLDMIREEKEELKNVILSNMSLRHI